MDLHKANLEAQNQAIAVASSHHQIPTVSCSNTNAGLLPIQQFQISQPPPPVQPTSLQLSQPTAQPQIKANPQPALLTNPAAVTTNTVNGGVMSTSATAGGCNPYLLTLSHPAAAAAAAAQAAGLQATGNPTQTTVPEGGVSLPSGLVPAHAASAALAAAQQASTPTQTTMPPVSNAAAFALFSGAAAAYHVTPKLKSPSGLIAVSSGRGTDKFSPY